MENVHREAAKRKADRKLAEKIILKYLATYIADHITDMKTEQFLAEAKSLHFFEGGAMVRTREIVVVADWAYQLSLISSSPIPDIPAFLQQPCFGSKNATHRVPDAPMPILLETPDIRKRSHMLWVHLCVLIQFWTDEAGYSEGNIFYGGRKRETSALIQYVMMQVNSRTRNKIIITWRGVVMGTPWLDVRANFSQVQNAALLQQPVLSELTELEKKWRPGGRSI